jgi:hypothetical protein
MGVEAATAGGALECWIYGFDSGWLGGLGTRTGADGE